MVVEVDESRARGWSENSAHSSYWFLCILALELKAAVAPCGLAFLRLWQEVLPNAH
ncbi:hypothetical protein PHSC3_000968 [Chlamydiales bacterium STE3]|nr:hypothetical protein PHSC3_000968 [Chlamydiales bacterium STE3]